MVFSFHIRYSCLDHCLLRFFCQDLIRRHMVNLAKHPVIDPMKCPECHRVISCTHPLPESLFSSPLTAYLVKVMTRISGRICKFRIIHSRCPVMTAVFPDPGPANTIQGLVPVADSLFCASIKIGKRGFFSPPYCFSIDYFSIMRYSLRMRSRDSSSFRALP